MPPPPVIEPYLARQIAAIIDCVCATSSQGRAEQLPALPKTLDAARQTGAAA